MKANWRWHLKMAASAWLIIGGVSQRWRWRQMAKWQRSAEAAGWRSQHGGAEENGSGAKRSQQGRKRKPGSGIVKCYNEKLKISAAAEEMRRSNGCGGEIMA